ncbi:hypothetical protein OEM_48730 [Mycobacterium intracellulare subsp. yongonense 05-1390]|uniref:hypothetical protein n=1 Tax=Mycobacterium TaxID=1763 RepID=UPI0002AC86E0|nr:MULTISPECIES: hypothetical protein [Mycobacterium]AGP66408.1 hypothetical protein OEM_48730 [Mycobacterium intracellulare subsp. yongonense 05-1390]ARR80471.1 hypothetical protein MOTT12_04807 [Mycobacterium intracellulare subsp. yongonense]ARR85532.1 hypothetical protein MOTT27_04711 [Mycobacterium intracellulare subsp. yongonense]ELR83386.1 hypothetical protein W7U_20275 [Mycobacterium sp. H4Y]
MRTRFDFDFVTTASPHEVVELMTDFSPNRPHRWPALSAKAFEVYHVGETEADVREGQDFPKVWAKWHYDWTKPNSVTLTVVESDAQAPGSFMTLEATPRPAGGSSVHGVWEQTSANLTGLIAVAMMRFAGPRLLSSYYKKVYDGLAA